MAYSSNTFNALDLEVKIKYKYQCVPFQNISLLMGINDHNDLKFLKICTLMDFPCIKNLNIKCNCNIHSDICPIHSP